MHFAFIPYGKRSEVELLLRDMEAQKHLLKMWKGKKEQGIYVQGSVKIVPLGVIEYIFPKEDLNIVLWTLIRDKNRYKLSRFILGVLGKLLKLKKIPEYKKDKHYLWIRDNVEVIPLGIREDEDVIEPSGEYKGWRHEAL